MVVLRFGGEGEGGFEVGSVGRKEGRKEGGNVSVSVRLVKTNEK